MEVIALLYVVEALGFLVNEMFPWFYNDEKAPFRIQFLLCLNMDIAMSIYPYYTTYIIQFLRDYYIMCCWWANDTFFYVRMYVGIKKKWALVLTYSLGHLVFIPCTVLRSSYL